MNKKLMKNLFLVLLMLGMVGFTFGDELDSISDGEYTFAAKRGTKLSAKHVISPSNFKLLLDDSNKALTNMSEVYAGQQFTISVKPNKNAYVYVLNLDSSNKLFALFPRKDMNLKNPIKKRKKQTLPSGDDMYEFDSTSGVEIFYAVASLTKIPQLEKLISSIPNDGKVISAKTKELLDNPEEFNHVPGKAGKVFYKKLVLIHKSSESAKVSKETISRAKSEIGQ